MKEALEEASRQKKLVALIDRDVRITLQVAAKCEKQRRFQWKTQKGKSSLMNLEKGWLTVRDALRLPEPDTSWMDSSIPRHNFTQWLSVR